MSINFICVQNKCLEEATVRIFWPGKEPQGMCFNCAAQAKHIMGSMGSYLHTEPFKAHQVEEEDFDSPFGDKPEKA